MHFNTHMQELGPWYKPQRFAVAVSGGSDSMALCLLMQEWAEAQGHSTVALTVDHGIRPEAAGEVKQVAKWLEEHSIEHHILTHKGEIPSSNIQDFARQIRYTLLTDWCKANNIDSLLVAHNLEDQAETFLMRLSRGSGIDGLSAMANVTSLHGMQILRPLLDTSRKELQSYLKSQNQTWIEDPTNQNLFYTRNKLRKALAEITDDETLTQRLAQTAKIMGRARAALEAETQKTLAKTVQFFSTGHAILDLAAYRCIPEEIALRTLTHTLNCIAGKIYKPRFEKLERLHTTLAQGNFDTACTLAGCKITPVSNNEAFITRELAAIKDVTPLSSQPTLWDNRFIASLEDKRNLSLNISALGANGWQKIKDEITSPNLPKEALYTLPAIWDTDLETPLAVPHIEYYEDAALKTALRCDFQPTIPVEITPFRYCTQSHFAVA